MNFVIAFAGLSPLFGVVCSLFSALGVTITVALLVLLERQPVDS
jgi:hypothetical protein